MLLNMPPNKDIEDAWTGDWFTPFFRVAVLYFLTDLAWICIFPNCVRSPATIIQHHIATLLYLYVPFSVPHTRWCMGACMSVEVNTWFLIARRVFNKQGFSPWVIGLPPFLSIRVKLVSIFFYLTWISVRCILYPYLLMEFTQLWIDHSEAVGTRLNVLAIVTPLHAIFCILNARWTYELIMSKVRYWRRKGPGNKVQPVERPLNELPRPLCINYRDRQLVSRKQVGLDDVLKYYIRSVVISEDCTLLLGFPFVFCDTSKQRLHDATTPDAPGKTSCSEQLENREGTPYLLHRPLHRFDSQ